MNVYQTSSLSAWNIGKTNQMHIFGRDKGILQRINNVLMSGVANSIVEKQRPVICRAAYIYHSM
jgi:hypothetical protein